MINAGKVRLGSLVEISLCKDRFATVHKVVCYSKSSKVFCCSNIMKAVLFRCTGQNHLSTLLFSAWGCSLLSVRLQGIFFFFFLHISRAGMLWRQEYCDTTSQLRGNHFLKLIRHDMKWLFFWKRNNRFCWGTQNHSVCFKIKNLRLGFLSPKFSFSGAMLAACLVRGEVGCKNMAHPSEDICRHRWDDLPSALAFFL